MSLSDLNAYALGTTVSVPDEVLVGNPYQRGLAHGRSHGDLIRKCIRRYGTHAKANASEVSSLVKNIANNVERKYPDAMAELAGIAAGTGLPEETICTLNFVEEIWAQTGGWPERIGCSNFTELLPEFGPVLAHTSDVANGDGPLLVLTESVQDEDSSYLWLRYAGTLWCAGGLNSAGLAVAGSSILGSEVNQDGIPAFLYGTLIMSKASSTAEALSLARGYKPFTGGSNTIVLDDSWSGAVVELIGGRTARVVNRSIDGQRLICANHPLDGSTDGIENDEEWLSNSEGRFDFMSAYRMKNPTSLNGVFSMLKTHSPGIVPEDSGVSVGRGLCQHGDKDLHTEASVVLVPQQRHLWFTRGRTCQQTFSVTQLSPRRSPRP